MVIGTYKNKNHNKNDEKSYYFGLRSSRHFRNKKKRPQKRANSIVARVTSLNF